MTTKKKRKIFLAAVLRGEEGPSERIRQKAGILACRWWECWRWRQRSGRWTGRSWRDEFWFVRQLRTGRNLYDPERGIWRNFVWIGLLTYAVGWRRRSFKFWSNRDGIELQQRSVWRGNGFRWRNRSAIQLG